jgi:GxxExxY protein
MNGLTEKIIGAAIEVHKVLGPGLLESAYEGCLAHELTLASIPFERQVPLPVIYKSLQLDLRISDRFLSGKNVGLGTKGGGEFATDSRSSTTDLSEIRCVANRVADQFQRACPEEGHQANGA